MSTNRVVVTGYGVTSPIGNTPEEFWNSLHDGKIGIKPITKFDASEIPVFNAGEIQDFPFDKYFVKKDTNRMDTYSLYAIYAAMEALENSGLNMEEEDRDRVGVIVSSGIGGLQELEDQIIRMHERGMKRIKPMFIPKALSNMGAGNIALKIGAQGVCKSVTTACASANLIQYDQAVFCRAVEDGGSFDHFHHKGAVSGAQIVAGSDPGENLVHYSYVRTGGRHEAAHLRHKSYYRHLAHICGLSRHVGAGYY